MARWQEGAAGRLAEAAMRLYVERGYEQTTVADIASEAGLTARTFFRHFADKREVLFAGSEFLRDAVVKSLAGVPATAEPMQAVAVALDATAELLGRDHRHSRLRQSVIMATAELRERELIKMATMAALMAEGLRERGVPARDAALAAESGAVVLRVAFEQWVEGPADADLRAVMRDTLARLTAVTGAGFS
ncbi:TetR/AcrR family transcriptional regulator [Paractinoplanes durhamensis]|uniref:TetR family transcriptional regulator n=1 Tax=Paractinoplanes durhamensis TaxID=113563 RepID=A0ABQ3YNB3_9ACTN|nr:TetR/AcrR family transcriptional regulator [Actinoplanes durhamensis]GID99034.1 TetR family transcriptional regulator [Actinoplanes durhamensis]